MTVPSKRLGRKRCCDATSDRCLEVCRLTIFPLQCKNIPRLLSKMEGFGGIPGPKAYQIKMNTPNVDACAVINSLRKVKSSRLERLYQTPQKMKASLSKVQDLTFIFQNAAASKWRFSKLQSSNSIF